jgi:hypothetical protein
VTFQGKTIKVDWGSLTDYFQIEQAEVKKAKLRIKDRRILPKMELHDLAADNPIDLPMTRRAGRTPVSATS